MVILICLCILLSPMYFLYSHVQQFQRDYNFHLSPSYEPCNQLFVAACLILVELGIMILFTSQRNVVLKYVVHFTVPFELFLAHVVIACVGPVMVIIDVPLKFMKNTSWAQHVIRM